LADGSNLFGLFEFDWQSVPNVSTLKTLNLSVLDGSNVLKFHSQGLLAITLALRFSPLNPSERQLKEN
jgi:hypothetical protein